jgi:hypothetical protein
VAVLAAEEAAPGGDPDPELAATAGRRGRTNVGDVNAPGVTIVESAIVDGRNDQPVP